MFERLTNTHNVSLSMAVWLAYTEYDDGSTDFPNEDVISATSLLRSPKQLILSKRVPMKEVRRDVMDEFSSAHGHALHDSIEKAWMSSENSMKRLGIPKKIRESIKINPDPKTVTEDDTPVYLEKRAFKRVTVDGNTFVISGKFDQVIDGLLCDVKKTGVYTLIAGTKDDDYALQGSIYRWLNSDIITSDDIMIQFIFTDWKAGDVKRIEGYPPNPVYEYRVPLMSLAQTESWIIKRIRRLVAEQGMHQDQMTPCTEKELWMTPTKYKYFTSETNKKATKVSENLAELTLLKNEKGKGVIRTFPGEPRACKYCAAKSICNQTKELTHD